MTCTCIFGKYSQSAFKSENNSDTQQLMAKIADAEETEAQEAAIWKRRGERSQTGGDVVMEGASDGGRTEEDYDGLVS